MGEFFLKKVQTIGAWKYLESVVMWETPWCPSTNDKNNRYRRKSSRKCPEKNLHTSNIKQFFLKHEWKS